MENAIVVESKPLSPAQCQAMINVLGQIQIPAGAAIEYIALRLALERIASGVDLVTPKVRAE